MAVAGTMPTKMSVPRSRRIGLTDREYDVLLAAQEGRCAICHRRVEKLVVEHRHSDGLVRGLVCDRCNALVGGVQDNATLLLAAALYLDSPPAKRLMFRFAPGSIGEARGRELEHCRHGRPTVNHCPYCGECSENETMP